MSVSSQRFSDRNGVLHEDQVDAAVRLLDAGVGEMLYRGPQSARAELYPGADVRAELPGRGHAGLIVVNGLREHVPAETGLPVTPGLFAAPDPGGVDVKAPRSAADVGHAP